MTGLLLTSRDRILSLVAAQPGLHLRELHRRAGLSLRTVRYHLEALGEEDLLTAHRSGRFERWFETGTFPPHERDLISALRVRAQRTILAQLLRQGPTGFVSLQVDLALSSGSLARHLHRLKAMGLVATGDDRRYRLHDPEEVRVCLASYRQRFPDLLADAAQEIFRE